MKYLVANWKAHMSLKDLEDWLLVFKENMKPQHGQTAIILAASAPHLSAVKEAITGLANVYCAAQSVSAEKDGSFTGEVTAQALEGLASYCIVGHSERRSRGETKDQIDLQLQNLKTSGITPILCIRGLEDFPSGYTGMVALERPEAIGTGSGTAVVEVMDVYNKLNLSADSIFLYGASVDENNCKEYLANPEIVGFLVGTASLDPRQFIKIAEKL